MILKRLIVCSFAVFALLAYFNSQFMPASMADQTQEPSAEPPKPTPFPSYQPTYGPPSGWTGPEFKLSQAYPTKDSGPCPVTECKWKSIDPKTNARAYLVEVLKYAYKGNLEKDWVQDTGANWFHAPWMHATENGREFIHGLTKERTTCSEEFLGGTCGIDPSHHKFFGSWAVGFYNKRGAEYIRDVWKEMSRSKPDPKNFPKGGFPEDTVTIKLLFTTASKNEVDYLENSVKWWGDTRRVKITPPSDPDTCNTEPSKCFEELSLLQIDVAVKDSRFAGETGWVFGTFVYNNAAKPLFDYPGAGKKADLQRWLRVEPVGLMFGNQKDETVPLKTSTPQHLGCDGRLNGPIDNPVSSCLSCHATSETPQNFDFKRLLGSQGCVTCGYKDKIDSDRTIWFRNINPQSNDPKLATFIESTKDWKVYSLDYSLQLSVGIDRYCAQESNPCGQPRDKFGPPVEVTRDGVQPIN
jgi:hypothetical protein